MEDRRPEGLRRAEETVYAVVHWKGFQYKVSPEETLHVPLTEAAPGSTLVLGDVLLVHDGTNLKVGTPHVSGAKVEAEVLRHGRGAKIIVGKFKRRKGHRVRKGHRQDYTEIRIRSIKI